MTGYDSKRAAAADKNNWRCSHGWLRGEQCEICNAPKPALEASLAQPAQEPVAWMWSNKKTYKVGVHFEYPSQFFDLTKPSDYEWTPLYTTPPKRTEQEQPLPPVEIGVDVTADGASVVAFYRRPNAVREMFYWQFHPAPKREWIGLTDEEILKMAYPIRWQEIDDFEADKAVNFAQMVEAKLKEKNT